MKLIVLYGKPKTGKTPTIKMLCKKIENDIKTTKIILAPKYANDDIRAMFEFNGKTVGITSFGDTTDKLKEVYSDFIAQHCDIIVSAGRKTSQGQAKTVTNFINSFAKKYKTLPVWVHKDYIDTPDKNRYKKEQDSINVFMADLLYNMI